MMVVVVVGGVGWGSQLWEIRTARRQKAGFHVGRVTAYGEQGTSLRTLVNDGEVSAVASKGDRVEPTYTGRKAIRRDGQEHFAEVTVQASPSSAPSKVVLSENVRTELKSAFGADFEHHRHNVWAAVAAQLNTANVAGEMPHAGATSFHVEVVGIRVSGNAGRELSGFLLSVASMDAILAYLSDWEDAQSERRLD